MSAGSKSKRRDDVPILGGAKKLLVRPWTMDQQDEIMPLVADLIDEYMQWQSKPETFSLGKLVLRFHREVSVICQRSVHDELEQMGLRWGDLHGEDLFVIAQAVWSTSISRPGGGGVLGKVLEMFGPTLKGMLLKKPPAKSSGTSPLSPAANPPNGQSQRSTPPN